MTSFLFKKEIWIALGCTIFFCTALYMYEKAYYESSFKYEAYAIEYMEKYYEGNKESFYERLTQDYQTSLQKMGAIGNLVGYEGPIETEEGSFINQYKANIEILEWQRSQEEAPGLYTPTVRDDAQMLWKLYRAMEGSENLSFNVENGKELMRREMRRQPEGSYRYLTREKAYEAYSAIDQEFELVDPSGANFFLQFFESDMIIFALLGLLNFGIFASLIQKKRADVVAISKMGMKKFTRHRILAAFFINTIVYFVYTFLLLFIVGRSLLNRELLEAPLQILQFYGTVPMAVSVGEYLVISVLLRYLLCMALCAVVLLISMVSRQTIIALAGVIILIGIQMYIGGKPQVDANPDLLVAACSGTVREMIQNLPYINIFGYPVLFLWGYGAGLIAISACSYAMTVSISRRMVIH